MPSLPSPVPRQPFQPALEILEPRCLLAGATFLNQPVVPVLSAAAKLHLQAIAARGVQLGNRLNVVAKVGDSNTETPAFLAPLGSPLYNPYEPALLGAHTDLAPTLLFYRALGVDGMGANALNHVSGAARGHWGSADLLNPWTMPYLAELDLLRPGVALIMIGTKDVGFEPSLDAYRLRLSFLVEAATARGVIPVLSTIPDIVVPPGLPVARVFEVNQVITGVAEAYQVPLWNYWLALQPLPGHGLSADGIHPNQHPAGSGLLTDAGVAFGYNMRNLTALQVLDKIRRVVFEDGPPDCPAGPLQPEVVRYVAGLYGPLMGRAPVAGELVTWSQLLQCGLPRSAVVQALWQTPEHRGRQVDAFYATYLKRAPDPYWRQYWVDLFRSGASEADVQRGLLTSSEYLAGHASDEAFLGGILEEGLGAEATAERVGYWQQFLHAGRTRQDVAQLLLHSPQRRERSVAGLYAGTLGRAPAAEETRFWQRPLQQGILTLDVVGQALLASDEFWMRSNTP